jgi:hypothetical protein
LSITFTQLKLFDSTLLGASVGPDDSVQQPAVRRRSLNARCRPHVRTGAMNDA